MTPNVRPLAAALVALSISGGVPSARATASAEPPPPTDAELTKLVGVQNALLGDPLRAAEFCAQNAANEQRESAESEDLAVVGRKLEANPTVGPILRQQGLSGRRYLELSVQVAAVLIGASIADEADATARRQGRPATSRDTLVASTPAAAPILARQAEITAVLEKLQALCGGDDADESEDEPEEEPDGEPDDGAER